jgi:hypothetical protein
MPIENEGYHFRTNDEWQFGEKSGIACHEIAKRVARV